MNTFRWVTRDPSALPLADDLADVLTHMVVGWEHEFGVDLAKHPEVVRVLARWRAETGRQDPRPPLTGQLIIDEYAAHRILSCHEAREKCDECRRILTQFPIWMAGRLQAIGTDERNARQMAEQMFEEMIRG
jgi:hypothetical protein